MKEEFIKLYNEFTKIKRKRWIKSLRKGTAGIGYTFETLLNKPEDNFSIPDYCGIEIKTMKYLSLRKVHLFCATPDGDILFPIKRVVKAIGYPDKDFPEYKILNIELKTTEYTKFGYKMAKIKINWEKEKIDLLAYNTYGKNYNLETSWSFEMLEKIFCRKLNYLAIIKACSKAINQEEYFFYNNINFYKRKNFLTFIKLIEEGIITLSFHVGIFKEGEKIGKLHDRGTGFSIMEKDLSKLFYEIDISKIINIS